MKLLKYCLFSLFLLYGFTVVAQTLEWSPPQKGKGRNYYVKILGENSSGLFMLRSRNSSFVKNVYLERYNASLGLNFSKELLLGNKSHLESMILFENYLLLFKSAINASSGKVDLLASKVDENGVVSSNVSRVAECPSKGSDDYGDFTIVPSANKAFIACSHTEVGSDKNSVLVLDVLTEQLQTSYSKKLELGLSHELLEYKELQVDNNGNVFFSAVFTNADKKKSSPDRYEHYMFCYFRDRDQLKRIKLDSGAHYINEYTFGVNYVRKRLSICGFYSNVANESSIGGHFYYNVDMESGETVYSRFTDFDKNLLAKLLGEREGSRNPELANMEMRKLVLRTDGGVIMVAENVYTTQQTSTYYVNGIPQYSYRTVYNYDDILVLSIDPDGKQEWNEVIKKKQASLNDDGYFSSFIFFSVKDKMHFIYNENVRGNGDVADISISNHGEREKGVLSNSKTMYVTVIPAESKQIAYNILLSSALKDRQYSLLRITY